MQFVSPARRIPAVLAVALLAGGCGGAGSPDASLADAAHVQDAAAPADAATPADAASPADLPATWALSGKVIVTRACAGMPASVKVFVVLSQACGDWTKTVESQELTVAGNAATSYGLSAADGQYALMAFMDCNGNASLAAPAPDSGDVRFDVVGDMGDQPCRNYDLHGSGVIDLPIELNTPVP